MSRLWNRITTYSRFVKIEHTLFSFPLLLSGAVIAEGTLTPKVILLVLIAGTGARVAALGLNRIFDRVIDRENPRTADRELPSNQMTLQEAILVTGSGISVYLLAALLISPSCLWYAPIPLAIFFIYPLMKRFTIWAHLGVGASLAMAPLGSWYAVQLSFNNYAQITLLCLFTLFWVAGFDIIYAILDVEFDREYGIHSLPASLGKKRALWVSFFFHLIAFSSLLTLYSLFMQGKLAFVMLVAIGSLFAIEHWKAADVEFAFFKVNAAIGFAIFLFTLTGKGIFG